MRCHVNSWEIYEIFPKSYIFHGRERSEKNIYKEFYIYSIQSRTDTYFFLLLSMPSMIIDYRKSLTDTLYNNTTYPPDIINVIVKKVIDDKYTLDFCRTEKYRVYNLFRLHKMGMIGDDKLQEIEEYQRFLTDRLDGHD